MTLWYSFQRPMASRTVTSATALFAAAVALAACSPASDDATGDSPQADTSMAGDATAQGTVGGAEQLSAESSPSERSAEPLCHSANLEFSTSDLQGGAGSMFFNIVLTNKGQKVCTLNGFPGVSLVTDNNGTQLGKSARREENVDYEPVHLHPGAAAISPIRVSSVDKLDPEKCKPAAADGLRVYPPEETKAGYIPMEGLKGCGGDEPVLSVQPVMLAE